MARGNVVMEGYYRDPEATAKAMRGGWFHSGDAAVVHPDGYVEIRDRFKDVIISGGENVSSVEVEGVLLRHPEVPGGGRRRASAREVGRSARTPSSSAAPAPRSPRRSSRSSRASRLAGFKTPKGVTFLDELPENGHRKGPKYVLREGAPRSPGSEARLMSRHAIAGLLRVDADPAITHLRPAASSR